MLSEICWRFCLAYLMSVAPRVGFIRCAYLARQKSDIFVSPFPTALLKVGTARRSIDQLCVCIPASKQPIGLGTLARKHGQTGRANRWWNEHEHARPVRRKERILYAR